jgi:hypothetical protein
MAAVLSRRRCAGARGAPLLAVAGLVSVLLLPSPAAALNNGLGRTPGLGWNSDYCLNCVSPSSDGAPLRGFQNDGFVRHIADFLVESGLAAMGYVNVNMDAAWDTFNRDASGNLVPDPALWTAPGGLNATIAYVHSRGLKFGLYGDRGSLDCSKRPGQDGHQAADAAFFSALGVDWFKMDRWAAKQRLAPPSYGGETDDDLCSTRPPPPPGHARAPPPPAPPAPLTRAHPPCSCYAPSDQPTALAQYAAMRDALNATGRPMWFALCGWEPWCVCSG